MTKEQTGIVFDFKKYAIHDGPGIRTTVFLKGCPLKCVWCHNPESWFLQPEPGWRRHRCVNCGGCDDRCSSQAITIEDNRPVTDADKCTRCGDCITACPAHAREIIGREMTVTEVMAEIDKDIIFYDQSGGGVTFSGGEPLMQSDFLLSLLDACRDVELHTTVDTTCHADTATFETVAHRTDLLLCDIKHMDPEQHREYTGVDNRLILKNIARAAELDTEVIVRIPIIPGCNADLDNIHATAKFVADLPHLRQIDILPYNRGGMEKSTRITGDYDLESAATPDPDTMQKIAQTLKEYGFKVRIGG